MKPTRTKKEEEKQENTVTMALQPSQPQLPDNIKNDNRDVTDLWKEALKAYKGIVGFDIQKKFGSLDEMVEFGVGEMNNFHKFRHNEKKVDRLRTLFATNLEYIQIGTQQLTSAAVPAFPPAAVIGTALTYMLTACKQVSADYDIVVAFFEDMNSFLQRIVILETRMPKYKAYKNCLMDVFTSFLTMCGFAHKYIELGRFKKFMLNVVNMGQDGELGGARKAMDTSLTRLQSATEFAILGNTEELQRMTVELQENQQAHTEFLQEQRGFLEDIKDTTEHIRNDMKKLLEAFKEQTKERGDKKPSVVDKSKPPSAKRVRNMLPGVENEIHEYHVLKETLVEDTCTWVFSEANWLTWVKAEADTQPILAIDGEPGMGKSHIAAAAFDRLWKEAAEDPSKQKCVAHFYFREKHQSLQWFYSALVTVINQVVEQNAPLCELINDQYQKDDVCMNVYDWKDLTVHLLKPAFRKESKYSLYLVLDGVDEMSGSDEFISFLKLIKELGMRVSILFSTRPELIPRVMEIEDASVLEIKLTKEKQMSDIKSLAWNRLNTLANLRKFSRYVKQRIADKTTEASPHMLYAEHMLLSFDEIGREGSVLRSLEKPMPSTLHDLYEGLLQTVQRRTILNHQQIFKTVLHLIAFSFRPLVLHEVNSLLDYLTDTKDSDIEEILQPLSAFIRVGDPGSDAEESAKINSQGDHEKTVEDLGKGSADSPDKVYNDASLHVKFKERSMGSFFRNAPSSDNDLHWSASEAHRQLFLMTAKLATPVKDIKIQEPGSRFKKYSTHYSLQHWAKINIEEHSPQELSEVMEAFWKMMSNESEYVVMIEWNGSRYENIFPKQSVEKVAFWAKLIESNEEILMKETAMTWWKDVLGNPPNVLLQLAKGHLDRLYKSSDLTQGLIRFRSLKSAVEAVSLDNILKEQAIQSFPDAWKGLEDEEAPAEQDEKNTTDSDARLSEKQAVLGLVNLFDKEMTATSYCAVAELLLNFRHRKEAYEMGSKALEFSPDSKLGSFKILGLLARIQSKRGRVRAAYSFVEKYDTAEYMQDSTIPDTLKRLATVTKARLEVKMKQLTKAAKSFADAKLADPSALTPGDVLEEELDLTTGNDDKKEFFETLRRWTPLERLTWMGWKYEDEGPERHALLRDYAVEENESAFVVQIYEESIKYLDNVNAGAPLRCDLALVYIQVCVDLEKGRKVLDEVFDGNSLGWPYAVTQELPDETIERAINIQSDLLYKLFRRSCDPAEKKTLLDATLGLPTRPLVLDVPPQSAAWALPYRLTAARMVLKMGTRLDFQKMMTEDIDSCIKGLRDKVRWNDGWHLVLLSKIMWIIAQAIPEGSERSEMLEASGLLSSARFSCLDPLLKEDDSCSESDEDEDGDSTDTSEDEVSDDEYVEVGKEGDADEAKDGGDDGNTDEKGAESDGDDKGGEEEEEDAKEERPTNEGDLMHTDKSEEADWSCDGSCNPPVDYWWWGTEVAYQCYTCDVFLCEECYAKRTKDEVLQGRQFCGQDHDFVKCPAEEWKGVKDGKLWVESKGEEVSVDEFLLYIQRELCKKAWDRFWIGS